MPTLQAVILPCSFSQPLTAVTQVAVRSSTLQHCKTPSMMGTCGDGAHLDPPHAVVGFQHQARVDGVSPLRPQRRCQVAAALPLLGRRLERVRRQLERCGDLQAATRWFEKRTLRVSRMLFTSRMRAGWEAFELRTTRR